MFCGMENFEEPAASGMPTRLDAMVELRMRVEVQCLDHGLCRGRDLELDRPSAVDTARGAGSQKDQHV